MEVRRTPQFIAWLRGLKDKAAVVRIAKRLLRVEEGLLGDVRPVGDGVSEMRLDFGPGYRLYFVQRGSIVVILLCGGDKGTQQRDITAAKALAADLED